MESDKTVAERRERNTGEVREENHARDFALNERMLEANEQSGADNDRSAPHEPRFCRLDFDHIVDKGDQLRKRSDGGGRC